MLVMITYLSQLQMFVVKARARMDGKQSTDVQVSHKTGKVVSLFISLQLETEFGQLTVKYHP